jgi:hypothetical protein
VKVRSALCGVCGRTVQARQDGRIRAHPAVTSRARHRQTCDGSGSFSARYRQGKPPTPREAQAFSRAAAFNAREAWNMASALMYEHEDMESCGAASPAARESARQARNRACADARKLADWYDVAPSANDETAA